MNYLKNTFVEDGSSEDIYQNMEDIRMRQNYDTKKDENIMEGSGNDEDIYQNFYDVKDTFEGFENEHSGNDEDIYQNFYDVRETLEDYRESS